MGNKVLFSGVVFCLLIGVWSQEEAATVSIPTERVEVKVGDTVPLECYGSNPSLSYYIKNRLYFSFTDMHSLQRNVTESFYPGLEFRDQFNRNKYALHYESVESRFQYRLTISAITHLDDGVYTCSLIGEQEGADGNKKEVVMSSQSVRLIVLNPVERITLQIKGVDGAVSTQPIVQGDAAVNVKPAQYEVICTAEGSNPAPVMSLLYNQNQPYIVPEFTSTTTNNQVKHNAEFHVTVNFDAKLGEHQTLTCCASLPNDQYPMKQAGLNLMVVVDKPDIVCANTSLRAGNKQQAIKCNITSEHGVDTLSCAKVMWKLPKFNVLIPAVGDTNTRRYSTEDKNTYEADCHKMQGTGIMHTQLMIYDVKPVHFSMIYEVMYGENTVETQIYEIVSSAHIILPSLLTMVAVAFLSRFMSKTL